MTPTLPYLSLALLFFVGISMGIAIILLTRLAGPRNLSRTPDVIKRGPVESGSDPIGTARDRFSVKFYMVALLFIVFDIEAVFMYPWAISLQKLGWSGLGTMVSFMVTLVVGLVYVWKKGVLEWGTEPIPHIDGPKPFLPTPADMPNPPQQIEE